MSTEEIQGGDRKNFIRHQLAMRQRIPSEQPRGTIHGAIIYSVIYSAPNKLCGDEFRRTRVTQPISWRERLMEKN
jgi:hypothetical protein